MPADGSKPLTVTGGLPFFGGPGNNYSMHALAEMAHRLRNGQGNGLITANGGMLSKHAALLLANKPAEAAFEAHQIDEERCCSFSVNCQGHYSSYDGKRR